jgi:hypothetical protein
MDVSPKLPRRILDEENFLEIAYYEIKADQFRPHGWRYRLAWIQQGRCRVLFDNHHGKADHNHIDGQELSYAFTGVEQLIADFVGLVKKLGGPL